MFENNELKQIKAALRPGGKIWRSFGRAVFDNAGYVDLDRGGM